MGFPRRAGQQLDGYLDRLLPHNRVACARYSGRIDVRDEARRLLDAVPESRVTAAPELLQQFVDEDEAVRPRSFSSLGIRHADRDLGARAKEIARSELGHQGRFA